jgi:hypothetical protein
MPSKMASQVQNIEKELILKFRSFMQAISLNAITSNENLKLRSLENSRPALFGDAWEQAWWMEDAAINGREINLGHLGPRGDANLPANCSRPACLVYKKSQ